MSLTRRRASRRTSLLLALVAALLVAGGVAYAMLALGPAAPRPEVQLRPEPPEATGEEVHRLCGACHAYPPAESFPRSAWLKEVKQGYDFFHLDPSYHFDYPPLESVVRYYEKRAPETLSPAARIADQQPCAARFERAGAGPAGSAGPAGVAHVNLVHLFRKDRLDVLVCDANNKQVLVYSPYESPPAWKVIARGLVCAHAEVMDLDGDGVNDVVLACLGNFYATDDRVGSVVWLKGAPGGSFTPIKLLDGLGRVADVRGANFTGAGRLDLVVAEFGWHQTGSIVLLENRTTDWSKPNFVPKVIDRRHGTTHVPVADLNGDGRPDFVAVISQEHETVVAFLNEGGGRFRSETIYTAPHPAYGCNGVQVVDLDADGRQDVLLSNGDTLDAPYLLRPDHGLTWLKNEGRYPFRPQRLADCYGAGSPVTADFDGNGLLDIAFVTFLPGEYFPQRAALKLDSIVLLEQFEKGKFARHTLEVEKCDHLSCAAGDLDGDGRPDLVVANYTRGVPAADTVAVWRNTTERRADRRPANARYSASAARFLPVLPPEPVSGPQQ